MDRMFSPFNGIVAIELDTIGQEPQEPRSVGDLFSHLEASVIHSEAAEMGVILAFLGAVAMIHQGNHWKSKGATFYEDHLMFERIYNMMPEEIDTVAERAVKMGGEEVVDTQIQAKMRSMIVDWVSSVYGMNAANSLAQSSLQAEECLAGALEIGMAQMRQRGILTKGTENMLIQILDDHESNQYLLQQACNGQ